MSVILKKELLLSEQSGDESIHSLTLSLSRKTALDILEVYQDINSRNTKSNDGLKILSTMVHTNGKDIDFDISGYAEISDKEDFNFFIDVLSEGCVNFMLNDGINNRIWRSEDLSVSSIKTSLVGLVAPYLNDIGKVRYPMVPLGTLCKVDLGLGKLIPVSIDMYSTDHVVLSINNGRRLVTERLETGGEHVDQGALAQKFGLNSGSAEKLSDFIRSQNNCDYTPVGHYYHGDLQELHPVYLLEHPSLGGKGRGMVDSLSNIKKILKESFNINANSLNIKGGVLVYLGYHISGVKHLTKEALDIANSTLSLDASQEDSRKVFLELDTGRNLCSAEKGVELSPSF